VAPLEVPFVHLSGVTQQNIYRTAGWVVNSGCQVPNISKALSVSKSKQPQSYNM